MIFDLNKQPLFLSNKENDSKSKSTYSHDIFSECCITSLSTNDINPIKQNYDIDNKIYISESCISSE